MCCPVGIHTPPWMKLGQGQQLTALPKEVKILNIVKMIVIPTLSIYYIHSCIGETKFLAQLFSWQINFDTLTLLMMEILSKMQKAYRDTGTFHTWTKHFEEKDSNLLLPENSISSGNISQAKQIWDYSINSIITYHIGLDNVIPMWPW